MNCWDMDIPLLVRRGGCGIKKISEKQTLAPQTEWSLSSSLSVCATLPTAPSKVASRHFLYVAPTPPHEEGNKYEDIKQRREQSSALPGLHPLWSVPLVLPHVSGPRQRDGLAARPHLSDAS